MKTIRTIIIVFLVIGATSFSVRAELGLQNDALTANTTSLTYEDDEHKAEEFEAMINTFEQDYLKNRNVDDRAELSSFQKDELSRLIQSKKNDVFGIEYNSKALSKLDNYTGGIFLQFDSSTNSGSLGWDHGHAAIGYGKGTVEIRSPQHLVTYYGSSRVEEWYQSNSGGFYSVRDAWMSDNESAADNAYEKIGSNYFLIDTWDYNGYTCSSLVAISWKEAGFDLGGKWTTPAALERHSKTVLQWLWTDVK